ncbi:hypothetical protein BH11MYX3_BH11MYX3_00240 [soil metagenome]
MTGCGFSVPSGLGLDPRDDAPVSPPGEAGAEAAVDAAVIGPFSNIVPLTTLNTVGAEDDATLTGDLLEIYFDRNGDLYSSARASASDVWPTPQPLTILNSTSGETTPEVSEDGLELFFSSTRIGGAGGNDIYVARRLNRATPFGNPLRVAELSTVSEDVTPTLVHGDLVMYLSSTRVGGVGGYDMWRTTRADRSSPWAAPVLIASLSTAGTETEPWVDPTETTIYLSCDGAGGRDLFIATRADPADAWHARTPVDELNSNGSEEDPWLSPDGHTMIFASSRSGNYELYMATR